MGRRNCDERFGVEALQVGSICLESKALWLELLSHLPGALASDLAEAFCQISIGAEKPGKGTGGFFIERATALTLEALRAADMRLRILNANMQDDENADELPAPYDMSK